MAQKNRTTLKSYFEVGDIPNQNQYADLIDSFVNLNDNNSGSIHLTGSINLVGGQGNISASGDISASGTVYAAAFEPNLITSGIVSSSGTTGTNHFGTEIVLDNNTILQSKDTAGNVQNLAYLSSGNTTILADQSYSTIVYGVDITLDASDDITIDAAGNDVFFKDSGTTSVWINTNKGHITASGDISASGTIYANNFKSSGGDISGVNFHDNLNITGSITASGDISSSKTIYAQSFKGGISATSLTLNGSPVGTSTDTFWSSGNTGKIYYTGGNVGIGTSTPVSELDVANGTITALSGSFSELSGNSPLTINGIVNFQVPITSSGNISSSGTVFANDAQFGSSTVYINGPAGHITASGNISASGTVIANTASIAHFIPHLSASAQDHLGNVLDFTFSGSALFRTQPDNYGGPNQKVHVAAGQVSASSTLIGLDGSFPNKVVVGTSTVPAPYNSQLTVEGNISSSGNIITKGHITASGGISSSGNIRAFTIGTNSNPVEETYSSVITMTSESGLYFDNSIGVENPYIYASDPDTTNIGSPKGRHFGTQNGHIGLYMGTQKSFRIAFSGHELSNNVNNASMSFANSASISAVRFQNLPTSREQAAHLGTGSLWMSGSDSHGSSKYLMVYNP